MKVFAFQPNRNEPPAFVAETRDELHGMHGEEIEGEQCEDCGLTTYEVRSYEQPFVASCMSCAQEFPITLKYEEEVTF